MEARRHHLPHRGAARRAGPAGLALQALGALLAAALAARAAAEGNVGPPRKASTATRVYGADFLKPIAGGLATVGGSTLRWIHANGGPMITLATVEGGHLSRLGLDEAGARIMAVWEKDPVVHLIQLLDRRHETFPLPPLGHPAAAIFYVHSLAFSPDGRDAIIYMSGPTRNPTIHVTQAFRRAFDGQGTLDKLWEVSDSGELIWASGRGALYIMPTGVSKRTGETINWRADLGGALTAFIVDGGTVTRKVVYNDPENKFRSIGAASGSTPERWVGTMVTGRGGEGLITYRWGDDRAVFQPLPPGPGPGGGGVVLAKYSDEVMYIVDRGTTLEIVRRALPPDTQSRSATLWSPTIPIRVRGGSRTLGSYVSGRGFRADGSLWLQMGDDMALIGKDGRVRRVDLAKMVGGHPEWAGSSVYLEHPEVLWVGIEVGAGRDWIRLDFAEMERRAGPWPPYVKPVPPVGSEQYGDRDRMTKCLPPDTRIATPNGPVPVSRLTPGSAVWTRDRAGLRVAGTVLRTNRVQTGAHHTMVELRFADGRALSVSAGHPLAGGAGVETLRAGAPYAGTTVRSARVIPYTGTETFDILPSGETGVYWADGIPLASTLK